MLAVFPVSRLAALVQPCSAAACTEEYRQMRQDFYTKDQGLAWQLIIRGELGAERTTPVADACESLLASSQEKDDGGFSMRASVKSGGGLPSMVIPCLTGNMVFSLVRLGYLYDPRVLKAM